MSNYTTNCIHHQVCHGAYNCQTKCQYFEERPQGDSISRRDIKDHISELMLVYSGTELDNAILNAIDNAESVSDRYDEGFRDGYAQRFNDIEERKENSRLFQKDGAEEYKK